ncbi:MAG: peptidylprolyl isomerase [Bdellovibrionales bacterium]
MKYAILFTVPLFAALLAVATPVNAAEPKPQTEPTTPKPDAGGDTVIAVVNGEKITKADLADTIAGLPPQFQQLPLPAVYPQLLEQMVVERVIRKAGYANNIDATQEVRNRMKDVEKKIVADEYLRREVAKKITDAQLKGEYDKYVKGFKGEPQVRASHILVKTEAEANAILKELKNGADFAAVAKEKSLDKGAAAAGGDLNYFSKGQMVEAFEKAAFAMKTGDVSAKPVKTEFGYHIIKLTDKRTSQPDTFEQMKPQLETVASQDAAKIVVKELMQKAEVQRFDLEGKPLAKKVEIQEQPSKKN